MRFLAVLLLALGGPAFAEGHRVEPYHWSAFQANAIGVFQVGGESFTGQAAWIPYTIIKDEWGVRGELGVAMLKSAVGGHFFALNYELFLDYWLGRELILEAGGGLATWIGNGGTHPIASLYVVGLLPDFPERLFLAYSRFFLGDTPANQIKVGAGFHF